MKIKSLTRVSLEPIKSEAWNELIMNPPLDNITFEVVEGDSYLYRKSRLVSPHLNEFIILEKVDGTKKYCKWVDDLQELLYLIRKHATY